MPSPKYLLQMHCFQTASAWFFLTYGETGRCGMWAVYREVVHRFWIDGRGSRCRHVALKNQSQKRDVERSGWGEKHVSHTYYVACWGGADVLLFLNTYLWVLSPNP